MVWRKTDHVIGTRESHRKRTHPLRKNGHAQTEDLLLTVVLDQPLVSLSLSDLSLKVSHGLQSSLEVLSQRPGTRSKRELEFHVLRRLLVLGIVIAVREEVRNIREDCPH